MVNAAVINERKINLHRFCEGFGVRVKPYHQARTPRPANTIYGGRTLKRLASRDEDRTSTVIQCIQASNPQCFDDTTILAVWGFIAAHLADTRRADVVAMFRSIDLAEIHGRAKRLAAGNHGRMGKTPTVISTLLADALLDRVA